MSRRKEASPPGAAPESDAPDGGAPDGGAPDSDASKRAAASSANPSSGAEGGRSVFGRPLEPCSTRPKTGFFRDGCCNTSADDGGAHVVCAQMTAEFLAFSRARGNDLSTPAPQFGFPGLRPGDRWCLCAARWKEAFDAGCAPPVFLGRTHERMLDYVSFDELKRYALDLN